MFFRTLLFLFLLYLLVKVISRLFLPGDNRSGGKRQPGSAFFYHFGNSNARSNSSQKKKQVKDRLDEIEEAEFEEIKEDADSNPKHE